MHIQKKSFFLTTLLLICVALPIQTQAAPWYRNPWNATVTEAITQLSDQKEQALYIPILFGISVGDFDPNFGVPRSGGRSHEGQDILGVLGTPIVSPTQAVVTNIQWGASAGHSVYTAIPGGETLAYLHLDRVNPLLKVGDIIEVGDLIGYLGDTGNAKGGAAHLHFEVLTTYATNPFPRLTKEFSAEQKKEFIDRMYAQMSTQEKTKLETFMAKHFPDAYSTTEQSPETAAATVNTASSIASLPDMTIGARGTTVIELQKFLINNKSGNAGKTLANTGATGYFGPLTRDALKEYQQKNAISPADGFFGKSTRDFLNQNITPKTADNVILVAETEPQPTTIPTETTDVSDMPMHNLTIGNRGSDVVWLQEYLIELNLGSAARDIAKIGASGYFGPLTRDALIEFQRASGVTPALGYYGPLTRAAIQSKQ